MMTIPSPLSTLTGPRQPFHASWRWRLLTGCLFSHAYPLWRRLNATDRYLYLECPRCGDQRRALETD